MSKTKATVFAAVGALLLQLGTAAGGASAGSGSTNCSTSISTGTVGKSIQGAPNGRTSPLYGLQPLLEPFQELSLLDRLDAHVGPAHEVQRLGVEAHEDPEVLDRIAFGGVKELEEMYSG
jgi:hypothetical protein